MTVTSYRWRWERERQRVLAEARRLQGLKAPSPAEIQALREMRREFEELPHPDRHGVDIAAGNPRRLRNLGNLIPGPAS